jgi:hypothetical protein
MDMSRFTREQAAQIERGYCYCCSQPLCKKCGHCRSVNCHAISMRYCSKKHLGDHLGRGIAGLFAFIMRSTGRQKGGK